MNLTSCDSCGIVLDLDKIDIHSPEECFDKDDVIIDSRVIWESDSCFVAIPCPCCKEKVPTNSQIY